MEKVVDVANKLQINPDDLMAVMAFESWLNPAQKNPGSSATGLIQFMESTAKNLGTTTEELSKMSGVQQMDYVYNYYQSYTGKLNDLEDVYMVTVWPKAVGKPSDYAVFIKGDDFYEGNSGLDLDGDGIVTKEEATIKVLERRESFE